MGIEPGEHRFHIGKLAFNCQGKGGDRAFHPFEDVDPQQVNQALLAVDLTEQELPSPHPVLYFSS